MTDNEWRTPSGILPFPSSAYDFTNIPDYDDDFVNEDDITAFARALTVPDTASTDDITHPHHQQQSSQFITALNDWRPIHQKVRRENHRKRKRKSVAGGGGGRGKDETREGYVYTLLKWPLLMIVCGWIVFLGAAYMLTRVYIYSYEDFITMRGKRQRLRRRLHETTTYEGWVDAAKEMDAYLGNEHWKAVDEYAYYNSKTIRRVRNELHSLRTSIEKARQEQSKDGTPQDITAAVEELRALVEAAVKDNFVGVESARLYSETYFGTKNLVQSFVDELRLSLTTLSHTSRLSPEEKGTLFRHLSTNHGRTALCLSGGATFAYYHFGVAKALLDADVLPQVITGTSGGALVAALLATRTDAELKQLLVPALAGRITACQDSMSVWLRRWYRTGARFDGLEWARRCGWFCHGSLTFREAYERTGRILNVTCIPSDPHTPTVLANYLTAPDCVIWSAVLASAAVPGILNPVVLMRKTKRGTLAPYSFGHRWKDGSLRTDVPLKALNTQFNVTFSIVSQVNPHINLFFFSSRGTVGRPVTHRRGRGWRGGFLGSATEQYLKLDLNKWLKVLRHLELLPRLMGQDWSELYLQRFSGTVTIWPKSKMEDFWHILSDPDPKRLARMLHTGQLSAWPKIRFVGNRMGVERLIDEGLRKYSTDRLLPLTKNRRDTMADGALPNGDSETMPIGPASNAEAIPIPEVLSEGKLRGLLQEAQHRNGSVATKPIACTHDLDIPQNSALERRRPSVSPLSASASEPVVSGHSFAKRLSGLFDASPRQSIDGGSTEANSPGPLRAGESSHHRRSSMMAELKRQSGVFWDDSAAEEDSSEASDGEWHDAEEWESSED